MTEKDHREYSGLSHKKFSAKQRLLKASEISMLLNTYDDIFSDFDPRPYNFRSISGDFLEETKRVSRDKPSGKLELSLLVPKKDKDNRLEKIIIRRLKNHFKMHIKQLTAEKLKIVKKGISFTLVGIFIMFIASYLLWKNHGPNLLKDFMITLLTPAGWFFFWIGLDDTYKGNSLLNKDLEFYKKMSVAEIKFYYY